MKKIDLQDYQVFINAIGKLLSFSRLYHSGHPQIKEKFVETVRQLKYLTSDNRPLIMASLGGVLFINEQKIELKNSFMQLFMESLASLQLGSIDIEPDFSAEEIAMFINMLVQKEHVSDVNQIKKYFQNKNITHIIPRFASYKLVKEDEKVVKEKEVINISALPQEVIEKFLQDLNRGKVTESIKESDINYKTVAHDPAFLSSFVHDTVEKKNNIEELEKILWLVGDYLIGEISSAKEEEFNRKILDEFKKRLLYLWKDKEDKNWKEAVHKNVTAISAALELKGLLVLYKKHKKYLENVLNKIKLILETLPQESQLYKKTKEELDAAG